MPANDEQSAEIREPVPEDFEGAVPVDLRDFEEIIAGQRWLEGEVRGLATAGAIGLRMAEIAESQKGVAESGGENRGIPYERYVKPFGGRIDPWCAYFVSWSYWQATGRRPPWKYPGAVESVHSWAANASRITKQPARGDMFGISGTHMGIVAARLLDGHILTIEGNTSNAVKALKRPIRALWYATP